MEETKKNPSIVEGTLVISGKGIGYVKNKEYKNGIEIDPSFLNTGLHGDQVKVRLLTHTEGEEYLGEIIEILVRAKVGFSGVLEKENDIYFLVPSDPKMYTDIIIPKENLNKAEVGQKVFGSIVEWKDPKKSPIGKIVYVLGAPRENNAEMMGIALEKGFESSFPRSVELEAEEIKKRGITEDDLKDRTDFRGITTFTIDPFDAKDFDDALSFEKISDNKYKIGIHIADVSHYVQKESSLDKEALRRATSVYLVDRTIPMLPEILSNDLCSLRPNEDRLAFSAVFTMNDSGEISDQWFGRTIINSDKRFTYEDAQKILDAKNGEYFEELNTLNSIAKKLTKKRFEEGAISLEQDEVKFILDENGVPISVFKKERGDTHKLIEEFMLLANRKVAEFVSTLDNNKEKIFVYRIHDLPDQERLDDLITYLKKLGYNLDKNDDGQVPSTEINALLSTLEGKEEQDMINIAVIRSMAKAIYSTKNIGHYGLAFEYYTHFTSPIRRYPDIVVHRLLNEYLQGKQIDPSLWGEYELISKNSSYREKEASEAERASIKYKQVEYMSYRIGETFDGVISGIAKWGIFVEEAETKCEGLVRLKDIGDDFYNFDEKEMMIVGQNTKKKYRVGDKVKIKVLSADMDKKTIDYIFV